MFCIVEHPTTRRWNGEVVVWPPRVASPQFRRFADAQKWARQNLQAEAASCEAAEVVGKVVGYAGQGVAVVRPVRRILGGFGRGTAYEAEL